MHKIYCDGGSVDKTHAACAYIITNEDDRILCSNSIYLGAVTSNIAEYYGIIFSMIAATTGGIKDVIIIQDSQLVSRQMTGEYQVKAEHLKPLHATAMDLASKFEHIEFKWVTREHPLIKQCDRSCDLCIESYTNKK